MSNPSTQIHTWTRPPFLISTDPALISHAALNAAFNSPTLYWAKPLPPEELRLMLANSTNFGLYTDPDESGVRPMIGFARLVTDRVTIAYLTDVYVLPEYQGRGLGSWLVESVKEWTERLPNMRQFVLIAKEGKVEEYYARRLGTGRMEAGGGGYRLFNRRGPGAMH